MRRNDGKLAEGWYDPQTLEKAIASDNGAHAGNSMTISNSRPGLKAAQTEQTRRTGDLHDTGQSESQDDDDDDFGPTLPGAKPDDTSKTAPSSKKGPSIPKFLDLQHARDMATEDALSTRQQSSKNLREDRKSEKALRTAHLDDLAPRAEPGTRERQLEKRREVAASNRAFASAKTDPTDVELPEADVMGGGEEGSLGELKRLKETEERKRSEREIRREEVMRAKREEREARLRQMRDKEERTMDMFREIARARFGAGGVGEGGGG